MHDLAAFATLAEEGSFTRAAAKLGMPQSSLSRLIKGLEQRLGVRLLSRTTRSVATTEAGEALLATLRPALDEIDAGLAALSAVRGTPAGTLRLTMVKHAAMMLVRPMLPRFLAAYPDIQVEIDIDDGFTDTEHRCINYRLASAGALYAWRFEKHRRRLDVRVNGPLVYNDGDMILVAAVDGLGIAYLFEELVAEAIADGKLVRLLEDWCPSFPGYYLYYPSRRQLRPALSVFIHALRAKAP
ncbi:LysR family transcriptional regulator [Archangium minus]|uniref:LysR family transcriptional regulator n=1 Tax=Archangium minus TaxID=83450 RepID=A0ABY9XCH0_9BACT|nr:LysR family transcriptional regulator [Archangium minus]